MGRATPDLRHVLGCYARAAEFDVISDHSGMIAPAVAGTLKTPVAHTIHSALEDAAAAIYEDIGRLAPQVGLISVSLNQRRPKPALNWVANCPNAIDPTLYPLPTPPEHARRDRYLLFLGRMSPQKGAHRAIETALAAGCPLKLAGRIQEPLEHRYFDQHIRPHLSATIEYLGEVNHNEKVSLLQNARATLFPIEWQEPFGLVLIESMACGTPVIAARRGAVPKIVENGIGGLIVDRWEDAAQALQHTDQIPPAATRRSVEQRFTPQQMIHNYLDAFERTINQFNTPAQTTHNK
jgi:glycosyltransferase involved in cell wall biosynthesis